MDPGSTDAHSKDAHTGSCGWGVAKVSGAAGPKTLSSWEIIVFPSDHFQNKSSLQTIINVFYKNFRKSGLDLISAGSQGAPLDDFWAPDTLATPP